ncbi:hypothetical protein Taro_024191 [Colocasia esculenta]|uniref:Uncharacterized protein n=1 Tax=Colocasia esculenta TaxID=4460 RepID=A0A843V8M9_COLES|nr:hypothetical protein [Colocasia esculenta]
MDAAIELGEEVFWRVEKEGGEKGPQEFLRGKKRETSNEHRKMSESLGHLLRQPDERGKRLKTGGIVMNTEQIVIEASRYEL